MYEAMSAHLVFQCLDLRYITLSNSEVSLLHFGLERYVVDLNRNVECLGRRVGIRGVESKAVKIGD